MIETSVIVTVGIFVVGVLVTAGRLLERQATTTRDLHKLETLVTRELGDVKRVLYTTIGGRRAIRPVEGLDDAPADQE